MARNSLNLAGIDAAVNESRAADQRVKLNNLLMQRQNRQFEREDAAIAKENAIEGAYRQSGGDNNKLLEHLQTAAPREAYNLRQKLKEQGQKDQAFNLDMDSKELAIQVDKANFAKDVISRLTPQNYVQEMTRLKEGGYKVADIAPPQFDPQWQAAQLQTADSFLSQAATKLQQEFTAGENEKSRAVTTRGQDLTARNAAASRALTRRGQDLSAQTALFKQKTTDSKPLPATALKMKNEALEKLSISTNINKDLAYFEKQISDGKLDFGYFSNLYNKSLNNLNMSTEESRNLASFQSTLEKLRNDSLRLNNGVQTDGDAQRAWNELFENINDSEFVKQRIQEIIVINERGANLQKLQVDSITSNYGKPDTDFSKYESGSSIGEKATNPNGNILPQGATMPTSNKPTVSNW